jgi:hypothetical protein
LIVSSHLILLGVDMASLKEIGFNNRFSSIVALIAIMEVMNLSRVFFSLCDLFKTKIGSS